MFETLLLLVALASILAAIVTFIVAIHRELDSTKTYRYYRKLLDMAREKQPKVEATMKRIHTINKVYYRTLLVLVLVLLVTVACVVSGNVDKNAKPTHDQNSCDERCVQLRKTSDIEWEKQDAQETLVAKYKSTQDAIPTSYPEWVAEQTRGAQLEELQTEWAATQKAIEHK